MFLKIQLVSLKYKLQILLLIFATHQVYYITKIGTWWDESYHNLAAKLTIAKIKFAVLGIKSNEYRYDFSDHEFFGMFYQIQVYFFSKLNFLYSYLNSNFFVNELHFTYFLRHIYLVFYSCLGLYFIFLLLKYLQSENFAFVYILFLILIPSINGFGLFDDKDIPYAIHLFIAYLMYLYFVKNFEEGNHPNKKLIFLTGLSFGLLLLIRFNGIAFLTILLISINVLNLKNLIDKKFFFQNLAIGGYSLLIFLLGTVQGWGEYPKYLKNLYWQQFKVSTWNGTTIVNGEVFRKSGDTSYLFKIFFYKLPLTYFLMILIVLFLFKMIRKNKLLSSSIVFLFLFFIAYLVLKPAAYSYERQYIFIFCFINLIASFSIYGSKSFIYKYSLVTIVLVFNIYTQYGLEEFKYTYLNEFVNEKEISTIDPNCFEFGDCGQWSTDHVSISGLEMAKMVSDTDIPLMTCAPYHTVSIFNNKDNYINLNENHIFKSGKDLMDYTLINKELLIQNNSQRIYSDINLFSNFIKESNIKTFNYLSEHQLTDKGNHCLHFLNQKNKLNCRLVEENFVRLRGTKVSINFLLTCDVN
tara:strand:+ start:61179 stop:62921 length:1743 start_codon:yes stop_codon:yes gene_type:complete